METIEKLEEFLIAQYDLIAQATTQQDKMVFFQQAYGGVAFAVYHLTTNSQESMKIARRWENDWREEFEKILYERD